MPPSLKRWLPWLALAIGFLLHTLSLGTAWQSAQRSKHARDFASYHYAVQVASQGGDPYDSAQLGERARDEGTRKQVYPFFYPPPFLLAMQWTRPLSLAQAFRAWFWLDALALLAAGLALWRWWPKPSTVVASALLLAAFSAIPNNHLMGQMNLPVMALTLWGMYWVQERGGDREALLGGALVGAAAMLKMSPGLLVLWWLLRGQWRPALAACGTALLLSVASLPVLDLDHQLHFYTQVLPSFSSGGYGGLTVPVSLFGNHSVANLWAQLWPDPQALSQQAQRATTATVLALTALVFAATRRSEGGLCGLLALSALLILMMLTPVYTYEHHVVWAIPAWIALAAALWERKLRWAWTLLLLPGFVVSAWPIADWKALAQDSAVQWWMQEAKFGVLVLQLGLCARLAWAYSSPRTRRAARERRAA